jgi:superfamily II DNA or RNA helicase
MSYIGKKGYTLFKDDINSSQIKKIRDELTVKPFSTRGQEVSYPIFRESEKKIYIPRYYGIENFGETENKLSKGETIHLNFKGDLFDFQKEIVLKYLTSVGESGGGLLDVEPGKGKTVMALNIISKLNKKTLVVVHKSFLMNQWIERIEAFLPDAKVGRIQGETIDVEGKDIVLGMIQSLSNKDYPKELWDQFGLCVFDECHHLSAEVFSNVMINIVTSYNLGLSGTMTRKDGLTKVFKYFIGPVIHKEKTDLTTEVFVKAIRIQNEDTFENVKTDPRGQPLYSCMISKLDYSDRNLIISNAVKQELKENENQQIMILAHTKSIVQDLFKQISVFEKSIGYYLGGMKEEHLKASESKKIILATYAMASEGLDIKTLTTLILATPKSDICQSVGRILRSKHSTPLVIDLIDEHPLFDTQYKKRMDYYSSKNFKIYEYDNFRAYETNTYKQILKKKTRQTKAKTVCLIPGLG